MAELIFVYNINSGIINAAMSSLHKLASPETYKCSLCAITHSALGEKAEWKDFVSQLEIESVFLHKDEFHEIFRNQYYGDLPAVFLKMDQKEIELIMGPSDIENLCLQELIDVIRDELQSL